ncbi:MAG TPA: glycoside hydrolase family 130 protein [Blastocatellia bacterium]|nr:glycoside hydrolase family 130 protein [Blastocatellia bacterium]
MKRIFLPLLIACALVSIPAGYSSSIRSPQTVAGSGVKPGRDDGSGWALLPFSKLDEVNPILQPAATLWDCPLAGGPVAWESLATYNPAAVVRDGRVWLLYRAQDTGNRTSRLGLASSTDGIHFTRLPRPVFYPDRDAMRPYEWPGGCEDPRLIEDERGTYYLTYTTYDGKVARLAVASSPDLMRWTKYGLAFGADGRYRDLWSKSGAVVGRRKGQRIVATKLNGKYWMYWGDKNIHAATSDDLIHWSPVELPAGAPPAKSEAGAGATPGSERLVRVLEPRPGKFDSDLAEPGPYALLTAKGILLVYNGRNYGAKRDPSLPEAAYTVAQALLDPREPTRVLERMDHWFLKPDREFERRGQVSEVVFAEGLVPFGKKWFLYYGTADSRIGVAVCETGKAIR